jgi:hypothetical protein
LCEIENTDKSVDPIELSFVLVIDITKNSNLHATALKGEGLDRKDTVDTLMALVDVQPSLLSLQHDSEQCTVL